MNRAVRGHMPEKVNPEKSDLSASLEEELRAELVEACAKDEISLSRAARDALKKWLAAPERRVQR